MWESVAVFLEKAIGLLTSQRTITTAIGVIVIVVVAQQAFALIGGFEPWQDVDEAGLEQQIATVLGAIATVLIALQKIVDLVKTLVISVETAPPSLKSDWKNRAVNAVLLDATHDR